ncbi:hypothetical protein LUZ61_013014 [Rhynchospora tenuis]|uniref:Uncharacterized protein n=1 Tax=Rhynchospora tenuis TaxID=198213 RepID=A0AAD6A412_9POAL|nr:hypothetical protein LUZ61_013014 [Rhynchospora tenuis]
MAALQRFKLLATQCTAAPPPSPSRSPAPPCFRLHPHRHRRRHLNNNTNTKTRTLRRLISSPDPDPLPLPVAEEDDDKKGLLRDSSRTLRDLFVSSPKGADAACAGASAVGRAVPLAGGGGGGWRFVGLRNRLLRRTWRPVLVAIPE